MGSEPRRERNNQINERIATGAAEVIAIPVDGPVGVLEAAIARREQDWMREKADNEGDGIMSVGGLAATTQPLDLDALLAIDAKRTQWEWKCSFGEGVGRAVGCSVGPNSMGGYVVVFRRAGELKDVDAAAIVSAVNALRPLVERCKQAEATLTTKGTNDDSQMS